MNPIINSSFNKHPRSCENAFVFRSFSLELIHRFNWSTSTERVRAPRSGYFNIKIVHKPHNNKSTGKQSFKDTTEKSFQRAYQRTTGGGVFYTSPEGSWLRVQKPWSRLEIFQEVAAAVGENSFDHDVCK